MGSSFSSLRDFVFFRCNVRHHVRTPHLKNLREHLIDGEHIELIKPVLNRAGNSGVSVIGHDVRYIPQRLNLQDFSNVFLIFDLDPQDTFFSAGTIRRMCKHFCDAAYEGKTVSQRTQTILRLIMQHCLKKALMLQGDELALWDTEKNTAIKNAEVLYERVPEAQLSYLSEEKTMQVLNTAVLLVFEYKKALLFDND